MSTRQKKSLILLVILTIITVIGFLVLNGVITYQQKMLQDNLELLSQISAIKQLYINVLNAENAKLGRLSQHDLIQIIQDPNYFQYFIHPIKVGLLDIDETIFSNEEKKFIRSIRENVIAFVASTKLAMVNESSLNSTISNFESAISNISSQLKQLNILQKDSIKLKISALENQKVVITFISVFVIITLITFSIYFAFKINNQFKSELQAELKAEKIQAELKMKADKIEAELAIKEKLAEDVQRALLPIQKELMDNHFNIAGIMRTAESVGGDYYDFIKKGDSKWFIIGDVTGHGLSSAVVMLCLKFATTMTIMLSNNVTPNKVLSMVNHWVNKIKSRFDRDIKKKTATFLVLHVDENGNGEYAGNHPDMLVYRKSTNNVHKVASHDAYLSIGLLPNDPYDKMLEKHCDKRSIKLSSGDKILLYTDGATEAKTGIAPIISNGVEVEPMVNEEGLIDMFKSHATKPVNEIVDSIVSQLNTCIIEDDITLLAIEKI